MSNKNLIKKELKELPLLKEQFGKSEGYHVPTDYFKELENNILQEVKKSTSPNPTRNKLLSLYKIGSKAAAIVLLVGGSLFMWQKISTPSIASTTDLSTEEIYAYITDNIQEFEEDLLIGQVSIDEITPSPLEEGEMELFLEELVEDPTIELEDIL